VDTISGVIRAEFPFLLAEVP